MRHSGCTHCHFWTSLATSELPSSLVSTPTIVSLAWEWMPQNPSVLYKQQKVNGLNDVAALLAFISSVQFSHSVVSNSLQPHGLQHTRLPCPSPTPGAYWNSCPLSQWCNPTISSYVVPFSLCLQSFQASGSLQMSQFFAPGGQSTGVPTSASVLPINIQDWFPLGWTGLIALQSKGLSRAFSNTTVQKHQFFGIQLSL